MKGLQEAMDTLQEEVDLMKVAVEKAAQEIRDGDEDEALNTLEELLGEDDADEMDEGDDDEDEDA